MPAHFNYLEITYIQAMYLGSLLQDLQDEQPLPNLDLQNPQLEDILVQELCKPKPLPFLTVIKDFLRSKVLKKNVAMRT